MSDREIGPAGSASEPSVDVERLLGDYAAERRAQGLPMIPTSQRRPGRSWLVWILVPSTAVLLFFAYEGIRATFEQDRRALTQAVMSVDSHTLAGIDDQGDHVWVRGLAGEVTYPRLLRNPSTGKAEAVFAALSENGESQLLALDPASGQTRWTRVAGFAASDLASGPLAYTETRLIAWERSRTVVATILAGRWYHCAIQSLDPGTGELIGTYYHPGHLHYGQVVGSSDRSAPAFLMFGSNSSARFDRRLVPFETERHCGAVVLLGEEDFDGQAYPYSELEARPDWTDTPPARERAYLCVAPIDPSSDATVAAASFDAGGRGRPPRIEARLADGRIVIMDSNLRPEGVYLVLDQAAEIANRDIPIESRFVYFADGREEWLTLPIQLIASLEELSPGDAG